MNPSPFVQTSTPTSLLYTIQLRGLNIGFDGIIASLNCHKSTPHIVSAIAIAGDGFMLQTAIEVSLNTAILVDVLRATLIRAVESKYLDDWALDFTHHFFPSMNASIPSTAWCILSFRSFCSSIISFLRSTTSSSRDGTTGLGQQSVRLNIYR